MDEKQYVVDALSIDESWRMFRIMAEFVEAIETLSRVKHAVSIFGSARTKPDDPYYEKAEHPPGTSSKRGSPLSRVAGRVSWRRQTRGPQRRAGSRWE